jgi:flagellar protein FliO/FliZ
MLDSFGLEMSLPVKFALAFAIIFVLILGFFWALRRFNAGSLGSSARGRQPRLAVIDHASVDGRRRLILVRRDNVEHLLMIGGPTDVVVEPNIVRAVASPRDMPGTRPAVGIESLPRATPLPENGSGGSWPLQPEPAGSPRPSPRLEPLPDEISLRPLQSAEPPPRPQRDTLAALADELGSRPAAPPRRSTTFSRPQPPEPRLEAKPEPRLELDAEPEGPQQTAPVIIPPAPPPPGPVAPAAEAADQSLADMASRLEAALRKPNAPPEPPPRRPVAPPRPAPETANPTDTLPPLPRPPRPSEPKPARTEAKPSQGKTALYDSLEQEMASLLGRPTKT